MTRYKLYGLLLLLTLTGCYKYKNTPNISNPAYLRVFNSVPTEVNVLTAGQQPFFCFLMDPTFDAAGAPVNGTVVGDWLASRELFSSSYPIDAGTALNAGNGSTASSVDGTTNYVTNTNYEYPGKIHVPTAPPMNGLDLSAWAQVPSGKHRLIFVSRPQNNTGFSELTSSLRRTIVIDTTVDLSAGEVYTLDAVVTNLDSNGYGAYLRQEQFTHESFDTGRVYAAFYNLSGKPSVLSTNFDYPYFFDFTDTMQIHYTYYTFDDNFSDSVNQQATNPGTPSRPLTGSSDVYFGTVIRGRDDLSAFVPLPFLPRSDYFTEQGVLRSFYEGGYDITGTMPYVSFNFLAPNPQLSQAGQFANAYPALLCTADPTIINTLDPDYVNNSLANPQNGEPPYYMYQSSLNMVVQSGNSVNVFPTINLFEIVYNHIYLMQLQHGFSQVPE